MDPDRSLVDGMPAADRRCPGCGEAMQPVRLAGGVLPPSLSYAVVEPERWRQAGADARFPPTGLLLAAACPGCGQVALSLAPAARPSTAIRAQGTGQVLLRVAAPSLRGAWLSGARLRDADLAGADLSKADLRGAELAGANLARARLAGAYLQGANLTRACLHEACLQGASFDATTRWPAGFDPVQHGCVPPATELTPAAPPAGRGDELSAPAPPTDRARRLPRE